MMHGTPNWFAYFALAAWFPLAMLFYWKLDVTTATVATILGGELFLPEHTMFNLPIFPDLDKVVIPTLAALVGCAFTARARFRAAKPLRGIDRWALLLILANVGTWLTNTDAVLKAQGLTS